ncbi:hypothetical protein ACFWNL_35930 [Kitasatospora sp. NPDC058397]|uniref:hypothetical protein n=1 Tax=unclassified Kitasatospora TaxID=2633591 RepID=UPI003648E76A
MPSLATIFRKIAGLPEPTTESSPQRQAPAAGTPQPAAAEPTNPWEAAGQQLARAQQKACPAPPPPRAAHPPAPWAAPADEKSGTLALRRLGRGVLWAVVVLAAVTGVRSWVVPPKPLPPAPSAPTPTSAAYPIAEAQAVAGRFARAYLGWDEGAPQQRVAALSGLLSVGAETTMGWDGKGKQDVLDVQTDAVTIGGQGQARVRVEVLVRSTVAAPAPPPGAPPAAPVTSDPQWVALDVPVVTTSGHVVVSGQPGLIGLPAQGPALPRLTAAEADSALTATTQPIAEAFFKALAAGNTTTAAAPGAAIPALPAGISFKALNAWSVDNAADSNERSALARVAWTLGGASIEQTYRVKLARVSSTTASTWQVAGLAGGATS